MSEGEATEALTRAFELYKEGRTGLQGLLIDIRNAYFQLEKSVPDSEGTLLRIGKLLLTNDEEGKVTRTFQDPCVIFVGQTNSGKSSLINEILDATVVKADDTPCTSRMVELSYGDNQYPVVQIQDKDGNLLEEVVMKKNFIPSGVANLQEKDRDIDRLIKSKVTAKINIPFLKSGVKIIDSPGKNENEQLDQMVDDHMSSVLPLIVYVIDGRTMLTTDEVKDISALRNSVPEGNIFFAITKCDPEDKVESDESDEEDDTEPVDLTVRSKLEVDIRVGTYRKLMDEGILERKPMSECRTYHTLSSRRVKMYRWALKKAQTDETRQTIAECTRHMQDFRRFKSSLLEFTREQLIKSITDAAKVLQSSLMTCLDYFIDHSNIFSEKLENKKHIELIIKEEDKLSGEMKEKVHGVRDELIKNLTAHLKDHKEKIIESAVNLEVKTIEIPEDGCVTRASVDTKKHVQDYVIQKVCDIIQSEVISKHNDIDKIFDKLSILVKRVQDKIKGEIPIHDALQEMFISKYTFDKPKIVKSIWQKTKNVLRSIFTAKPLREYFWSDDKKKNKYAEEVFDDFDPSYIAGIIIEQILEHISKEHESFTLRLKELRSLVDKVASLKPDDMAVINKMKPVFSPLQLRALAIVDRLNFGEIKYGEVRGKGAQGVVQDCDAVGPSGEACVAKIIKVETETELGEIALEVHYWRKLSHKHLVDVFGTFITAPPKTSGITIIMPKLKCNLLKALPTITDIKIRLNIALQTADALTYIHDRKMMHRNIKADNVLLDDNLMVKVSDFGLCKAPGISSDSVETSVYAAPEIIRNRQHASPQVDVYAFGILLWYICEGQGHHPKYVCDNVDSLQELMTETCTGKRPEKLKSFPDDCWKLMEICWAHEPVYRPDMKDVYDRLTRIIQSI